MRQQLSNSNSVGGEMIRQLRQRGKKRWDWGGKPKKNISLETPQYFRTIVLISVNPLSGADARQTLQLGDEGVDHHARGPEGPCGPSLSGWLSVGRLLPGWLAVYLSICRSVGRLVGWSIRLVGGRYMLYLTRSGPVGRSFGRSLGRSSGRSVGWSVGRSIGMSER